MNGGCWYIDPETGEKIAGERGKPPTTKKAKPASAAKPKGKE